MYCIRFSQSIYQSFKIIISGLNLQIINFIYIRIYIDLRQIGFEKNMIFLYQVILGGGRSKLMPNNMSDPEYPDKSGLREDGEDLIKVHL